jgi:hypothetical protein
MAKLEEKMSKYNEDIDYLIINRDVTHEEL